MCFEGKTFDVLNWEDFESGMATSKSDARKRLNATLQNRKRSYFKGRAREIIEQVDRYCIETNTTDSGLLTITLLCSWTGAIGKRPSEAGDRYMA
jgi:hypothetical protein